MDDVLSCSSGSCEVVEAVDDCPSLTLSCEDGALIVESSPGEAAECLELRLPPGSTCDGVAVDACTLRTGPACEFELDGVSSVVLDGVPCDVSEGGWSFRTECTDGEIALTPVPGVGTARSARSEDTPQADLAPGAKRKPYEVEGWQWAAQVFLGRTSPEPPEEVTDGPEHGIGLGLGAAFSSPMAVTQMATEAPGDPSWPRVDTPLAPTEPLFRIEAGAAGALAVVSEQLDGNLEQVGALLVDGSGARPLAEAEWAAGALIVDVGVADDGGVFLRANPLDVVEDRGGGLVVDFEVAADGGVRFGGELGRAPWFVLRFDRPAEISPVASELPAVRVTLDLDRGLASVDAPFEPGIGLGALADVGTLGLTQTATSRPPAIGLQALADTAFAVTQTAATRPATPSELSWTVLPAEPAPAAPPTDLGLAAAAAFATTPVTPTSWAQGQELWIDVDRSGPAEIGIGAARFAATGGLTHTATTAPVVMPPELLVVRSGSGFSTGRRVLVTLGGTLIVAATGFGLLTQLGAGTEQADERAPIVQGTQEEDAGGAQPEPATAPEGDLDDPTAVGADDLVGEDEPFLDPVTADFGIGAGGVVDTSGLFFPERPRRDGVTPTPGPRAPPATAPTPPPTPAVQHSVTISNGGGGVVRVVETNSVCPPDCTLRVADGTTLTIVADGVADLTGACTGRGSCQVTVDGDLTVAARFFVAITTIVKGEGAVSVGGSTCDAECVVLVPFDSQLTATQQAGDGWTFITWENACTGSGPCSISAGGPAILGAVFQQPQVEAIPDPPVTAPSGPPSSPAGFDFHVLASGTSTVTAGSTTSFSLFSQVDSGSAPSNATLSASGMPAGMTITFSQPSLPVGNSTSVFAATTSSTSPGTYTITITANVGGTIRTTTRTIVVSAPSALALTVNAGASAASAAAGSTASFGVGITVTSGSTASATLSCTSAPAGFSVGFSPTNVSLAGGTGGASAFVSVASSVAPGTYTIEITATSGSVTSSTTKTVNVTAPPTPDFTLSMSSTTRFIQPGGIDTTGTSILRTGGHSAAITFSGDTGDPNFSFGTFNQTFSGVNFVFGVASGTAVGSSVSFQIVATDGTITRTIPVTINVVP